MKDSTSAPRRALAALVASLVLPLVGATGAVGAGCGSSSSGSGTPHDGGHGEDAHRGDAARDGSPHDTGPHGDAKPHDDAGPPVDAGIDVPTYPGLDAAIGNFGVSAACKSCVEAHCASQAEGCVQTAGCVPIEQCALKCVAAGTAPMTCATTCILGDASIPDGSTFQPDPAQMAAELLDFCFAGACAGECT